MKKNIIVIVSLIFIGLVLGCESKIDDLEIGEPLSQTEGIEGTWELEKVDMVDEFQVDKPTMDLSDVFLTDETTLVFDASSDTYTIDTPDDIPNFLGEGGAWSFDNELYPKVITLGGSEIELGAPIYAYSETLVLKYIKYCDVNGRLKPVLSYRYQFKRA